MKVTNPDGRTFHVRVVQTGDRYGLEDCLTHDHAEPMIEFFDTTYAGKKTFGPLGQFVSRYHISTLTRDARRYDIETRGLDLAGDVDVWWISAANVRDALAYAARVLENVKGSYEMGPTADDSPACGFCGSQPAHQIYPRGVFAGDVFYSCNTCDTGEDN